ncbi:hypothetical protein [Enterovirga sp. CN4-39]|uniref:hypothetical protein n=1 Tax=Enterovirga sp. CN4-39 TaxID=3400910 RepID=UPI003C01511A
MASEAEELLREFERTREELDEMAEEIASAEARVAELARADLQLSELRSMLEHSRRRHAQLDQRERALRAKFRVVLGQEAARRH